METMLPLKGKDEVHCRKSLGKDPVRFKVLNHNIMDPAILWRTMCKNQLGAFHILRNTI